MEKHLNESLIEYSKTDFYPFHMPGHKRMSLPIGNPYDIDITEIGGFDNLAHPRGLIKNIEDRLSKFYGCDRTYMLVNGSTCGNLSMIYASCKRNGNILVARNCHKSVIHAVELKDLKADYIYPEVSEDGIQLEIAPSQVEEKLAKKHYDALIITSPTYEGVVSDIKRLSEICHREGTALLVDAAHGAHFGMNGFPENPVNLGADAVAVSLHKTLPMFTQTAALLVNKDSLLNRMKLEESIRIFQSSSPSYILMSGVDRGLEFLERDGEEAAKKLNDLLLSFRRKCESLKNLKIVKYDNLENSKIVILSLIEGFTGQMILETLREKYHLELEMAVGQYALAMTTVMDKENCLERLYTSLNEIDNDLEGQRRLAFSDRKELGLKVRPDKKMEISEAKESEFELVSLDKAAGRISYNEVCVYPPGVADLLPGEQISEDMIEYINRNIEDGHEVEGVFDGSIYCLQEH